MKNQMNMQPLPGQTTPTNVLFVDLDAGHKALAEAAQHRAYMLETFVKVLSVVTPESVNKNDWTNLFCNLNTLLDEVHGLHTAAYHAAISAPRTSEGR